MTDASHLTPDIYKKEDQQLLKDDSTLIVADDDRKPVSLITHDMDDYLALYGCTVFAEKTDRLAKDGKTAISFTIKKQGENTYYIDFSQTASNLIHHIKLLNDLNLVSADNANPYFKLFHKYFSSIYAQSIKSKGYFDERQYLSVVELGKQANRFFDEKESTDFIGEVNTFNIQFSKTKEQLNTYIDELYERNSRMMMLRLDLFYGTSDRNKTTVEQAHTDNNAFIQFLKNKYESDLKGYVWKMEYGRKKGFCIRYVVLLSGSKFREDITVCKILGDKWKYEITQFRGSYYNRNVYKRDHEQSILGMKTHDDKNARKGFYKLMDSFAQTSLYVKAFFSSRIDYIGVGELKPISKRGRPRKTVAIEDVELKESLNIEEVHTY